MLYGTVEGGLLARCEVVVGAWGRFGSDIPKNSPIFHDRRSAEEANGGEEELPAPSFADSIATGWVSLGPGPPLEPPGAAKKSQEAGQPAPQSKKKKKKKVVLFSTS